MDKPTFYGIIPANVRYAKIADRAKLIFSEITAMSNKWGYCNASNGYFAQVWECDPSVISRHVSSLESIGAIHCEYIREGKQVKERRIFPLAMGGVLHPVQEGIASDAKGVLHGVQGGIAPEVKDNTTRVNNTSSNIKEPQKQNDILAIVHDQVNETAVKVVEVIPSKAKKAPKYIYPPTIEELVQPIYEKLIEKKRIHTNIVDCWNNANMQAEKFHIHWEEKGWKIEKLNLAIAKWVNNSISYGQVTKPCPIQYKGNPANAQPAQPTKVHVEERPALTQHDIEYSQAAFASVEAMFKQMGV